MQYLEYQLVSLQQRHKMKRRKCKLALSQISVQETCCEMSLKTVLHILPHPQSFCHTPNLRGINGQELEGVEVAVAGAVAGQIFGGTIESVEIVLVGIVLLRIKISITLSESSKCLFNFRDCAYKDIIPQTKTIIKITFLISIQYNVN